jgi:hypothetical protein
MQSFHSYTSTLVLLTSMSLSACRTRDVGPDPAPRYANRIQVARYDLTPRQPTTSFEVLDHINQAEHPYKIIAMLSHAAKPSDSGLMINAMAWHARRLGANAMILLTPQDTGYRSNRWGSEKDQPIYGANAIIFTTPP